MTKELTPEELAKLRVIVEAATNTTPAISDEAHAFWGAFDPPTCLALLDEIATKTEAFDDICEELAESVTVVNQLKAKCDDYLTHELDFQGKAFEHSQRLKAEVRRLREFITKLDSEALIEMGLCVERDELLK